MNTAPKTWADGFFLGLSTPLQATFVQPAISSTVLVAVKDSSWMAVGGSVFVQGGGYYSVSAAPSPTSVTLKNLGGTANVTAGTTVTLPANVLATGPQGTAGAAGGGGTFNLALANGANENVVTDGSLLQVVGGPTASYQLGSIAPTSSILSGQTVVFQLPPGQLASFVHNSAGATGGSLKFALPGQSGAGVVGATQLYFGKVTGHWDPNAFGMGLGAIRLDGGSASALQITPQRFGAVGDGVHDDTTAIQAAMTAFAALAAATSHTRSPAPEFDFGIGCFKITAPITCTGAIGGIIRGHGHNQTLIVCALGAAFSGAKGWLVMSRCQYVTVEKIHFCSAGAMTMALTANVAAGATSCTVASTALLSVGQRIVLTRANGTAAEEIGISALPGGGVIDFATVTLYSYTGSPTTDSVAYGSMGMLAWYSDYQPSHSQNLLNTGNIVKDCHFGDGSSSALSGISWDCLGGPPSALTAPATSGTNTATFADVSRMFVGETITFSDTGLGTDVMVIAAAGINYATNTVTFTGNLAATHTPTTAAPIYGISESDANNDQCKISNCFFFAHSLSGIRLAGYNSVNHVVTASDVVACPYAVTARQGGQLDWIGGSPSGNVCEFDVGGLQGHAWGITNITTEDGSAFLYSRAADKCSGFIFFASHVRKAGAPTLADLITVSGSRINLAFSECLMGGAQSPGNTGCTVTDVANVGSLHVNGGIWGASYRTLAGVNWKDNGPDYISGALTDTIDASSSIVGTSTRYGSLASANAPTTCRSNVAVGLGGAGTVHNLATFGDATLECTSSGDIVIDGFAGGVVGQRFDLIYFSAHNLTIAWNTGSTVGNRVFTGSGASIGPVTPSAGGYLHYRFEYSKNAGGTAVAGWRMIDA
jgi:hypothetical protein